MRTYDIDKLTAQFDNPAKGFNTDEELVVLFQHLIDHNGLTTPERQRMAQYLAAKGLVKMPETRKVMEAKNYQEPFNWVPVYWTAGVLVVLASIPFLFLAFVHANGL